MVCSKGRLASDLRDMGFELTERQSPMTDEDERGMLWSNGYELVCDETGTVIDGNHNESSSFSEDSEVYKYRNSRLAKLPGGYTGSYDWGNDDDERFTY